MAARRSGDRLRQPGAAGGRLTRTIEMISVQTCASPGCSLWNTLREPRRALHARIAATLQCQFREIAETQPELLARHYSEGGLIEKATELWGKAARWSLERAALREAGEQFRRALALIASLPSTPELRRERINFQVGLTNALMHTEGRAAPETTVSVHQTRALIERAQALGDNLEDPLLLFSAL
jgi:predicted ATPase